MTTHSLFRLNDLGIFGNSGIATITGYTTGASGTAGGTATLNVSTTPYGVSTAIPANSILSGNGVCGGSSCSTINSGSGSTYAITFPAGVTSANLGSSGSPVAFSVGRFKPWTPIASSNLTGYIDAAGGVPTLHVTALPTTPSTAAANFTGSLGTQFTASIASGTPTLVVTSPAGSNGGAAALGLGMTVNIPGGTPSTAHIQSLGTALGFAGTYTLDATITGATGSEAMFGTGILPGPPTALFNVGSVTGTIATGQYVTDGGINITANPLLITGGSGTTWTVGGSYYPSFIADGTMVSSYSSVTPGQYILNAGISTPVKILSYQGACGITGSVNGSLGCYTLSASPNPTGLVGSSGARVAFVGTTITDSGAIAPGPALKIRDRGPGITFPVTASTISCSSFGSCTGTGTFPLSGSFDTSVLGGTPSILQAQISLSADGPPIPGCSACAWTNLSGYTTTLSSGTVFNWSGQATLIPAGGPYYVAVRAANGQAYATLPSSIRVGLPADIYGQGQAAGFAGAGTNWSWFSGLFGTVFNQSSLANFENRLLGPPLTGDYVLAFSTPFAGDRNGATSAAFPLSETNGYFQQLLTNAFGWSATLIDITHDGEGNQIMTLGNTPQTQTIAVGDGTKLTWCSTTTFCANAGQGAQMTFNAAALTGAVFSGSIATVGSVSTLTVNSWISGALEPGMVVTAPGISPKLVSCSSGCTGVNSASSWIIDTNLGTVVMRRCVLIQSAEHLGRPIISRITGCLSGPAR